jgi:hypothetical protein
MPPPPPVSPKVCTENGKFCYQFNPATLKYEQCFEEPSLLLGPFFVTPAVLGPDKEGTIKWFNWDTTVSSALSRTGWVASASHNNGQASFALDGDTAVRWTTLTNQVPGMWFKLDLAAAMTFNLIRLVYPSGANDWTRDFTVEISQNNTDWTQVSSGTLVEGGHAADHAKDAMDIIFDVQTARYVRINQNGASATNIWSIGEINLHLTSSADANNPIMPAGTYRVSYVQGALDYDGGGDDNTIHDDNTNGQGFWIANNAGLSFGTQAPGELSGAKGVSHATLVLCEAGSAGMTKTITQAVAGPIGVYNYDSVHADNVSAARAVQYKLEQLT